MPRRKAGNYVYCRNVVDQGPRTLVVVVVQCAVIFNEL